MMQKEIFQTFVSKQDGIQRTSYATSDIMVKRKCQAINGAIFNKSGIAGEIRNRF
jgi:hypothetical protein